ncbi:ROK family protein [Paenibacillus antri]|uniref:ROK family protein n=2 Tax=Paenibacillus antri TaxID=2582848 RepID=A0A5R9G4W6_9BACL|nr:ROK family protein [Paenibacillus antri]
MKKVILRGIRTTLLASGSATKVELSEKLEISFPTVSKFVARLEKTGELMSVGLDDSSGGRRARRYAYNPDYQLGVALFLEKTETQYMIYNLLGEVKETGAASGYLQDGFEALAMQIESLLGLHPRIRTLVFGIPGSVDNGRIIYIPGYEKFRNVDLKGYMEARFALPVVVENDMNAAVLGYYDKIGSSENSSMIYLYFGQNGPGAGILVNGNVVRGSTSFSGEVSFVPLYDDRNFQQALAAADGTVTAMQEAAEVDAVSRLVASFAAILNPNTVVFCRNEVTEDLLDAIATRSAFYIAKEHLPKLTASDWREDYLNGLTKLGRNRMISGDDD